jgi:hypothetical protein
MDVAWRWRVQGRCRSNCGFAIDNLITLFRIKTMVAAIGAVGVLAFGHHIIVTGLRAVTEQDENGKAGWEEEQGEMEVWEEEYLR